jgi:hypothetical protein
VGVVVRQKVKGKGQPWWVFISHSNKRTSRKIGDKKAADQVASKIQAKLKLGELDLDEKKKPPVPLFKDFAKGFMETYSAMNHKESTQESYQQALDRHILPYFGNILLDEITRKKEALKNGWSEPPEFLFYNETGNPIDINNVRKRVFYKCLEKAGLRRIRTHDLRHTYATLRISKGDNILDVSRVF